MVARVVTLTEAKAKLSELLDAVERGEEIVIVRHGQRIARLRSYLAPEAAGPDPSVVERLRQSRVECAADRKAFGEIFRREGSSAGAADFKRLAREGLEGVGDLQDRERARRGRGR
jgi:prevent-host-death family protein